VAAGLGSAAAQSGAMYQMLSHTLTKSFCFYGAGAALLAMGTREIASVRGLIRTSPAAGAALLLGGLAIAGAPPFAVFLSEFSIFRAGLAEGRYLATSVLMFFVAIAFFGILVHINRMVFGGAELGHATPAKTLPFSCVLALIVSAVPVLVLGVYMPQPLHELLRLAVASLTR
jgi:hydrogenase-4 component F